MKKEYFCMIIIIFFFFTVIGQVITGIAVHDRLSAMENQVKAATSKAAETRRICDSEFKEIYNKFETVDAEINGIKKSETTLNDFIHLRHW